MLVGSPPLRIVDAGDVPGFPEDGAGNATRAEAAVLAVVRSGAVPIVLGGDDSVPIPVLRAYADHGPLTVLQVDAHLDFRDEVAGVRDGYSSAMRRASEMDHVDRAVEKSISFFRGGYATIKSASRTPPNARKSDSIPQCT